jgi:hypothetical protein
MGRGIGFGCLVAWIATVVAGGIAVADDAAWRDRVLKHVMKLEVETATLDEQTPTGKTLLDRVVSLNERVRALETTAGLKPGVVKGVDDLDALSMDVAMLQTRLGAVRTAREPKKAPPPPPAPAPAPDKKDADPKDAKPKDDPKKSPAASKWPDSVRFLATSKLLYAETGSWIETRDDYGVLRRDFLMDGYRGTLSLSLRAANLKTDVRAVVVRLGVRMKDPFVTATSAYKVYDVRWEASNRVFGNESLKNLPAHDVISVQGPIRYIVGGPRDQRMSCEVEAYVISATLQSGEVLSFEPPKFE